VLHGIVREHLETFLARARGPDGDGYPRFVEQEFRKYIDCGVLGHGFARLRCPECWYERLVAFSCKGKLCPSCLARRAGDTAAWLVDHLLPEAGYRQWVLTFPYTLRFRLAADRKLLSAFLRMYLQTVFGWQCWRGRALGIAGGQMGAVTFVLRFGGAINCNPHLHSILPDGLWVPGSDSAERLRFEPLPPPSTADVEELLAGIARRLAKHVAAVWEAEGNEYLDPSLAALVEAFFFSRDPPVATRASGLLPGMEGEEGASAGRSGNPLCASFEGFSLHAAQARWSAGPEALERLLRYGLRAPFAQERLSLREDGKVIYRLRRPCRTIAEPRTSFSIPLTCCAGWPPWSRSRTRTKPVTTAFSQAEAACAGSFLLLRSGRIFSVRCPSPRRRPTRRSMRTPTMTLLVHPAAACPGLISCAGCCTLTPSPAPGARRAPRGGHRSELCP
jgi:hypothetical protein